jgi:DNA-binding NarL/FixJ family response regulator
LTKVSVRILLVDDYAPFRILVASKLEKQPGLHVVGLAADGLEAVQQAEKLQPDLVLLDIGLRKLNGIEAARQIRLVSPKSILLFLSANSSLEVAREALSTGARGYVMKVDVNGELLAAVYAVLTGEKFVSHRFSSDGLI